MSLPGTSSDRSNRRHQCNPMRQNCPRMMLASHSRCGHSLATCVARSESDDLCSYLCRVSVKVPSVPCTSLLRIFPPPFERTVPWSAGLHCEVRDFVHG